MPSGTVFMVISINIKFFMLMIPLKDFQVLPIDKKCDYITSRADYLIYRTETEKKYFLYHIDFYYVEVCFLPKQNKVAGITAFLNTSRLKPYLELISLEGLGL